MGLFFGKFNLLILEKIKNVFLITLIIFSSFALNISGFLNKNTLAAEPLPTCLTAEIIGDGSSNIIEIVLTCENVNTFTESRTEIANSVDLLKIKLHPNTGPAYPSQAIIIGGKISLSYLTDHQTSDNSIQIDSGTILNDTKSYNQQINIASESVIDKAFPHAQNDYYFYYLGVDLEITASEGVLLNDDDYESQNLTAEISQQPANGNGIVDLKSDGSFIFTPPATAVEEVTFKYFSVDESDNKKEAIVYVKYAEPTVKTTISTDNIIGENHVKVGDTITIEVNANAPIAYKNAKIGVGDAEYVFVDSKNFIIQYVMQEDDIEGELIYSFSYSDLTGKSTPVSPADIIIFDKTAPVIDLDGDEVFDIDVCSKYEDFCAEYDETAFATDNIDGAIEVIVDGIYDLDVPGTYELSYAAVDKAGNWADEVTRQIVVHDSYNEFYVEYYEMLLDAGIDSNIYKVDANNYEEFSSLYFEKIIDDKPVVRFTYGQAINMNEEELLIFLPELYERIDASSIDNLVFDFSDTSELFVLKRSKLAVNLIGLDKIGIDETYSPLGIYNRIILSDSSIEKSSVFLNNGTISSCSDIYEGCYSYDIDMQYFTDFRIDNVAPEITLDKIMDGKNDGFFEIHLSVDSSVDSLALYINNRFNSYLDIKAGIQQIFQIKYSDFKYGKSFFRIVALDLYGNESMVEFDMINTPAKKVDAVYYYPVFTVVDNNDSNLADDNNGKTLNQKNEIEVLDLENELENVDEGGILSWYWGMVIISVSGLVVWWMIEGAKGNNYNRK